MLAVVQENVGVVTGNANASALVVAGRGLPLDRGGEVYVLDRRLSPDDHSSSAVFSINATEHHVRLEVLDLGGFGGLTGNDKIGRTI